MITFRQLAFYARWIAGYARCWGADARLVSRRLASMRRLDGGLSRTDYMAVVAELVVRHSRRLASDLDLYCRCLGAFPGLVKMSLLALAQEGRIQGTALERGASAGFEYAPWENDDLDLVEFEWYFDAPSVRRIISCFPSATKSVVSLSVPTVAPAAAAAGYQVTLLDRSPSLKYRDFGLRAAAAQERLEFVRWDLGEKPYMDAEQADVVVLDPPWYMDHYRAWLYTATLACRDGGLIVLPLPQLLTNRRSFSERKELRKILSGIGSVKIFKNVLSYVTPSFERAVLAIDDLEHLVRWRRADLAVVKVRHRHLPYEFTQVPELDWKYRRVEGRVIRTWGERSGEEPLPGIDAADRTHGYRLTSVSRNYLTASAINLVTSGGRAAVVRRWGQLPQILDLMQDDVAAEKAIEYALPGVPAKDKDVLARLLGALLEREGSSASLR